MMRCQGIKRRSQEQDFARVVRHPTALVASPSLISINPPAKLRPNFWGWFPGSMSDD